MHNAFLYISLPSLHDCDEKMANFTFCGARELKTTTFFLFSQLRYSPLEFNSRKFANIWRIEQDGISAIKFKAARDVLVAVAVVIALISFLISPFSSLVVNLVITEITVRCNAKKALLVLSVKEPASVLTTQPVTRQMVHATVCQGG